MAGMVASMLWHQRGIIDLLFMELKWACFARIAQCLCVFFGFVGQHALNGLIAYGANASLSLGQRTRVAADLLFNLQDNRSTEISGNLRVDFPIMPQVDGYAELGLDARIASDATASEARNGIEGIRGGLGIVFIPGHQDRPSARAVGVNE